MVVEAEETKARELEEAKQREKATKLFLMQINNDLRIHRESLDICTTTNNFATFLSRYDLATNTVDKLCNTVYPSHMSINGNTFANMRVKLISERPLLGKQCLDRAFKDTRSKANMLKTEKGKKNKVERFFKEFFEKYSDTAHNSDIEYIRELMVKNHVDIV